MGTTKSRYYFANDLDEVKNDSKDLEESFINLKIEPITPEFKPLEKKEDTSSDLFLSQEVLEAERMIINLQFIQKQLPNYINNIDRRINKSISYYQSVINKNKK